MPRFCSRFRAYLAIILLGGGMLAGGLGEADLAWWPFANYAMFSRLRKGVFYYLELRAIPVQSGENSQDVRGPELEIPLKKGSYLQPFNHVSLSRGLARIYWSKDPHKKESLRISLSQIKANYERLAQRHKHSGPHVSKVRLYLIQTDTSIIVGSSLVKPKEWLIAESE